MKAQHEYKTEIQKLIDTWQDKMNRVKIDKPLLARLSGIDETEIDILFLGILYITPKEQVNIDKVEQALDRELDKLDV